MCWRYSIKARALIHAHLSRISLKPDTLEVDRMQVIKKCPYLVQEMVHCAATLVLLAYSRRGKEWCSDKLPGYLVKNIMWFQVH